MEQGYSTIQIPVCIVRISLSLFFSRYINAVRLVLVSVLSCNSFMSNNDHCPWYAWLRIFARVWECPLFLAFSRSVLHQISTKFSQTYIPPFQTLESKDRHSFNWDLTHAILFGGKNKVK